MNKPSKNNWHASMFDSTMASRTISSALMVKKARAEAQFLIREIDKPIGSRWLDVPCGSGRHALQFARAGYLTTGIDISKDCLKMARKHPHRNLLYRHCDMAHLENFRGRFDVVTNLFTSFGYFASDSENEKVLKGLANCLKAGGVLAINTMNRSLVRTQYDPVWWREDKDYIMFVATWIKNKYEESRVVLLEKRNGKSRTYYARIRLYTKSEMVSLFKKIGLKHVRVCGDFSGAEFDPETSARPIYLGVRAAE